jgi:hypothetical protein
MKTILSILTAVLISSVAYAPPVGQTIWKYITSGPSTFIRNTPMIQTGWSVYAAGVIWLSATRVILPTFLQM